MTLTNEEGVFHLSGCAKDFNWFIHINHPDPYIRITHKCKRPYGSKFEINLPKKFMPDTIDVGLIDLDNEIQIWDRDMIDSYLQQNDVGSGQG